MIIIQSFAITIIYENLFRIKILLETCLLTTSISNLSKQIIKLT